ncbi:MAG TPA: capsular biosynthesis protein [Stellaceae bacterium]
MDGDRTGTPCYLILQGMPTPFLAKLGAALAAQGYTVKKINFTGGDRVFWRLPGAADYRGDLKAWPKFLETRLVEWRVSDIVLFGDCRPLHRAAVAAAARRGIRVHVIEEGYLRPNWITVAKDGVNGNSVLPLDPDWFLAEAAKLPPWHPGAQVTSQFRRRAVWDVSYHVSSLVLRWYYPRYRTHLVLNPFREYAGWVKRTLRKPLIRPRTRRAIETLNSWRGKRPFFLFPLQLESDSQLVFHSTYDALLPALEYVLASFARHAPAEAGLVIKEHPLDPGLTDWHANVTRAAARLGIADRVLYIRGCGVEPILDGCAGVVTLNSTTGFLALSAAVPVVALAKAIYNMPGLTFQDGLDRFWAEATRPDPAVFDAFRRVVAHRTQVNGGFFSTAGLALAVEGTIARLIERAARQPVIWAMPVPVERDPANHAERHEAEAVRARISL